MMTTQKYKDYKQKIKIKNLKIIIFYRINLKKQIK